MDRRSFLKRLGIGAAVGTAAVVGGVAFDIDPERLLWVPGAKTYFLPSEPLVEIASEDAINAVAELHGHRLPRYTLTVAGRGTVLFDENWQVLNGKELANAGHVSAEDVRRLQAEMQAPRREQRVDLRSIGHYGGLPVSERGKHTRLFNGTYGQRDWQTKEGN